MPQPSKQELIDRVDQVLQSVDPGVNVQTVRQTEDAAYAAYVFTLILRAARQVADTNEVVLRSIQTLSTTPSTFVVRGAPGYIHSSPPNYGFGVFRYNGRDYEIHLGVQYHGASRVLHEFDISILEAADAIAARTNRRNPSSGKAKIVFECKFYAKNLGIGLGREFVGLINDFQNVKSARLVTNAGAGSVRQYLVGKIKYRINDVLDPNNPAHETQFVNAVADDLKNRLR